MSTTSTVCTCNTCPGAACTCGCQPSATVASARPASSCQCGEVCHCGADCTCQPRADAPAVAAEAR